MIRSETLGKNVLTRVWTPLGPTRGDVLVLHGLGDHSARHDWAAGLVGGAGSRSVGFDWPGCGASDGVRGDIPTVEECCDLLDEMLDVLDLVPTGVFAHSTGAFILLHWLARRGRGIGALSSLRWVWLNSPLVRPSHSQPRLKIALATALARWFPRMTLNTGVRARDCYHTGPDPLAEMALARAGVHHRVSLRFATSLLAEEGSLISEVGSISPGIDFLLAQGCEDRVCPPVYAEELFRALPDPQKTWVLAFGARHEPFRESGSHGITDAVRAWLRSPERDLGK